MIENTVSRNYQLEKRISLRDSSETFVNVIANGTGCSLFEAEVIANKTHEVFWLGPYSDDSPLQLELQPNRNIEDNLADLPQECNWCGKKNSKGKIEYWCGYKLHLSVADGGVPLAAILTSASPHDSQVAIPLMQTSSTRATVLYDLADSAYDAPEIKDFSKALGRVPIIDPNKRRREKIELSPAENVRYRERSAVERSNSDLKDNYGGRHIRVKGHRKVFTHLMFGVIAITVKQLFNMLI